MVMTDVNSYLTDIPPEVNKYGFCKVLAVRREIIHIKHIFTEIFVRKSVDIEEYLNYLELTLFDYMSIMTNRMRNVYHFSRLYQNDCNRIVKSDRDKFFLTFELYKGLTKIIALDFDGVVTKNNFRELYQLCISRANVHICSANPNITNEWFRNKGLYTPHKIHSMKGKVQKIKQLIELQKKYNYVFYVDNEIEYLKYAWIFGIQTYHYDDGQIKYFSMKTK
jgi:hypothetical protein